jgi:branched-chain amino acid aminotransferase
MNGITRGNVIALCRGNGIPVHERNFSLTDVYGADDSFVTGSFGGLTTETEDDGRKITDGPGATTRRLRDLYLDLIERECPPD